jgi:hypothetical protein
MDTEREQDFSFMSLAYLSLGVLAPIVCGGGLLAWQIRRRHMQRWLPTYLRERGRRPTIRPDEEIHAIICIADHYEPKHHADSSQGMQRVATWCEQYPRQFARFRDSDGRPPRYSFFFPIEEYEKQYLDALAELCRQGFGEVEVHLHHDNDTADNLRKLIVDFKETLVNEHGLLSRHKETGDVVYGFIHGNWALCNSRPDRRWCGVNNEIEILRETGCYADFTFPSAPDVTQPPIINRIYHAAERRGQPCGHEIEVSRDDDQSLLMVQGPLVLNWRQRRFGLIPGIENGCLQNSQLPSMQRLDYWLHAHVQVPSRPDWFFVKLHAHGAPEDAHEALLGQPMVRFHEGLAKRAEHDPRFHFHYVTARELANLVLAAESGFTGSVDDARDWLYVSNLPQTIAGRKTPAFA